VKSRLLRNLKHAARRRGKLLVMAATLLVALLATQQLALWITQPGEALQLNPYPQLWPDWGSVGAYAPSPPTWQELGPSAGATDLVVPDPLSPGTIFAAGRFIGIYRSSDGGATWEKVGSSIGQYYVTSLVVDPALEGVAFAVAGGGLYSSTDGGTTWSSVDACGGTSVAFALDDQDAMVAYLSCDGRLLASADGGRTWAPSYGGEGLTSIMSIAASGGRLVLLGVGLNQDYFVLRSGDGGSTWSSYDTGWPSSQATLRPSVAVDPANSSVVLANAPQGIMLSRDGGANWTQVISDSYGVTGGFVSFDPYNYSIYAGRVLLYRSDDSGATFHPVGTWDIDCLASPVPVYHADIGSIAFLNAGREILMGTDGGVDISTNGGGTWACSSAGMKNALTYDVGVDPFEPSHVIVTRQDYFPAQSFDYGRTWQTIYSIQSEWGSVRFDPHTRGVVYIATGGGVWKSKDEGDTFSLSSKGLPTVPFPSSPRLAMDEGNPRTLWLSLGSLGLYKSDDGAATWQQIAGVTDARQADARGAAAYAVVTIGGLGGVWESTDGGGSWHLVNLPQSEQYYEVKIDPNNSSVVYVVGTELHVSHDGGATFDSFPIPADLVPSQHGAFGPSPYTLLVQRIGNLSRIVLASAKFGSRVNVYQSMDDGATWEAMTGNLGSTMVAGISFNPSYPVQLFLATFGEGVLSERVEVPVSIRYTINGPAAAFTPPMLTYVTGGQTVSVEVLGNVSAYYVDWGTFWVLSSPAASPPSQGRWLANETTAGTAAVPTQLGLVYTFSPVPEG
jgi:photosystem II stability/assembly factor-like uncharacterized protein